MKEKDLTRSAGLESWEQAKAQRDAYVAHLRNGDAKDKLLAEKLQTCSKLNPCESGACPLCTRALRKRHVDNIAYLNKYFCPPKAAIALTLVPSSSWARGDHLADLDLTIIKQKLAKRMRKSGIAKSLAGGIDISRNEDEGRRCWHAHAQIIAWADDTDALAKRLRNAFPAGATAIKPVFMKVVHHLPGAASYTLKNMFVRRVSYVDKTGRRNSRKVRLTGPETRELLCWLDRYPLKHRVIGVEPCSGCGRPHPVTDCPTQALG